MSVKYESSRDPTRGGLFILICLTLGIFFRRVLKSTPIPYTALLLFAGIILGLIMQDGTLGVLADTTAHWASIDPHLFLFIFLPPLIYEGTIAVDFHVFKRSVYQMLLLAGPGVVMSTGLTAGIAYYLFDYDWGWNESLAFGAMMSATDPVAVVSLMKQLGASEKLAILIEGESLFNDGTAMVLFILFENLMKTNAVHSPVGAGFAFMFRLSLGGPLLGYVCGYAAVNLLSKIVDDPTSEITLTIISCYGTFFLAEASPLGVSGVLAVVVLGLYMSYFGKTAVSHMTEQFMHEFWELLGYVANTLIFVVSGAVMVEKTHSEFIRLFDIMLVLMLYVLLHIVRGTTILILSPLLRRSGYGLSSNQGVIMTWAGLRGAIGLALGLMVEHDEQIPQHIQDQFMFHMAGIALLTILINGGTTGLLLKYTKMDRGTFASKKIFETAVHHIEMRTEEAVSTLKSDSFYTDADWSTVWSYIPAFSKKSLESRKRLHPGLFKDLSSSSKQRIVDNIENSFLTKEDEEDEPKLLRRPSTFRMLSSKNKTPSSTNVLDIQFEIPGLEEVEDFQDDGSDAEISTKSAPIQNLVELKHRFKIEGRHRFYSLLRSSYWHQYETGFAGKQAVRALVEAIGKTEDKISKLKYSEHVNEWKYLQTVCTIPLFVRRLYNVPVVNIFLRRMTFQLVTLAFDVATSFIYAHRRVKDDFSDLMHNLELHYEDDTLRKISQEVGKEVLAESKFSQGKAKSVLEDIHQSFPEVARAVVTRQASYAIIEDMRQFSKGLMHHGEIEEKEFERIEHALVKSRKRLLFHPPKISLRNELQVLQDCRVFRPLSVSTMTSMYRRAGETVMNKDDVLYKTGDKSNGFYVIIRGTVRLRMTKKGETGDVEATVDRVGPGSLVGVLGFMTGTIRHSTVVCDTYVQAYFIDNATYLSALASPGGDAMEVHMWQQAAIIVAMNYITKYIGKTPTTIRQIFYQATISKPKENCDVCYTEEIIVMKGGLVHSSNAGAATRQFPVLSKPKTTYQFKEGTVLLLIPRSSERMIGGLRGQMLESIKSRSKLKIDTDEDMLSMPPALQFGSAITNRGSPTTSSPRRVLRSSLCINIPSVDHIGPDSPFLSYR